MIVHHDGLYTIFFLNLSVYFLETKKAIRSVELLCHLTEAVFLNIFINTWNVLFKTCPILALRAVAVCQTNSTCSHLIKCCNSFSKYIFSSVFQWTIAVYSWGKSLVVSWFLAIMKILAYTANSCSFAIEFMLTFIVSIKQHLRIKYVTITGGAEIIAKVRSRWSSFQMHFTDCWC